MPRLPLAFAFTALLASTGCATLLAPTTDEIAGLPVVRYGDTPPSGQRFVLHYPAGAPLPVETKVQGNLLARPAGTRLEVTLQRDVYVLERWASFDGKTWRPSNELIDGRVEFAVPGHADPRHPGRMNATFDVKG